MAWVPEAGSGSQSLITDTVVATVIAPELANTHTLFQLPAVTISCSHEHSAWAGTVSISATALYSLIGDIYSSAANSGLTSLVILNGHGGNYVLGNVVQEGAPRKRMAPFPSAADWAEARQSARLPTGAIRLRRLAAVSGIIRDDAARGMSIRQIASRHRIHRRIVRQALAEPAGPPPCKRGTRPAPAIGPVQNVLDKLADQPLTVWQIWTTVTDQHDSDASYTAVRDYIRSRRLAGQPGPSPGQIMTNDQVQRRLLG